MRRHIFFIEQVLVLHVISPYDNFGRSLMQKRAPGALTPSFSLANNGSFDDAFHHTAIGSTNTLPFVPLASPAQSLGEKNGSIGKELFVKLVVGRVFVGDLF